ncbi:hypothetical protein HZB60_09340 [candidate division KSB1 bacterium]|nr:hypothetical protein [candidate division KSB1 bacterium]
MKIIAYLLILLPLVIGGCKPSAPPPKAVAPKPAAPGSEKQAVPAVQDSIAEVIATFINAMKAGNEKQAKAVLALEYFEHYSLPGPVEIKQYTITERTVLDSAEIEQLGFVEPPHVGDARVRTEQYMTGNVLVYGTYWLRKINGYWKIWGWGLS